MSQRVTASLPMDWRPGQNIKFDSLGAKAHTIATNVLKQESPPRLTEEERMMLHKRERAAVDHYINPDMLPVSDMKRATKPLVLQFSESHHQGPRPTYEDALRHREYPHGTMMALGDGHGTRPKAGQRAWGQVIAELVVQSAVEALPACIERNYFNTHKAHLEWAEEIQTKIPEVPAGTTLVTAYFERINHYLHVASCGDSEVIVFRKRDGLIYPIPLTPILNWQTPACVERMRAILTAEEFAEWEKQLGKTRRCPPNTGVNISSTLGDKMMHVRGQTAISHVPECTLLQLEEDDIVMLACDGVHDVTRIDDILDQILRQNWDNPNINLARAIAEFALVDKKSTDNVTVMIARVVAKKSAPRPLSKSKTLTLTHLL